MRKTLLTALFVFLALLVVGCCKPVPTPDPRTDIDLCPAACAHLEKLGCEEGQDLPDGTTCAQFCTDTQNEDVYINPRCLATRTSCDQEHLDECGRHEE